MIAEHNHKLKKVNNLENMSFLAKQIQIDRNKKDHQHVVDKKYYKTHFGPEETDEMLD